MQSLAFYRSGGISEDGMVLTINEGKIWSLTKICPRFVCSSTDLFHTKISFELEPVILKQICFV